MTASRCPRCLLVVAALVCGLAQAQAVYRSVGPDGRVRFSDLPPTDDARASRIPSGNNAAASPGAVELPYELRQTVQRYPVTLYTTLACTPCQHARTLLQARGIPYTERTVTTPQDGQAFQTLSSEMALPLLTIGTQQLKGFSETQWQQYLSAAGYPAQSRLPAGYRPPAPRPLALPDSPGLPAPAPRAPEAPANRAAPTIYPANPTGIIF